MKLKSIEKNSWLPADKQRSKRAYLERLVETEEAEDAIREFHEARTASSSEVPYAQNVDEEGSVRDLSA